MKIKLLLSCLFLIVAAMLVSATIRKSSSGAPASHTGAPSEKTCATAGCHDDTTPNIGTAQVSLEFGNNEKEFIPGHTYPIKVKISDSKVTRFGFQILALENKSQRDMGTFQITD